MVKKTKISFLKRKILKRLAPYVFIFVVWSIFAYPFFLSGKAPFASNYQVNFFPPWSAYQELAGPIKNNAMPDVITQIYPWRALSIDTLKHGQIPLWNPYSFAGTPHLANYQSAALFPLNILFFLPLSFVNVWSILVLLQPLLAGLFTFLFLKSLRIKTVGSIIGSISFMFAGFITTWMGYTILGYSILFLPLALFSIEKFDKTLKLRYLILLSGAVAFSFLSGHFQTSLYFLIFVLAYILFNIFFGKIKRKHLITLTFVLFGFLIAMPQILPSIEFYNLSVRSSIIQKIELIPWRYLPTLFAPDYYGNPVTRNDWFGHYAEWNGYSGIIPFALAIFVLFVKKNRVVIFFLSGSIITLLLAYGSPLYDLLFFLKIPVLSTSAASRIIVLFSFSIAVLSGFGFDYLFDFIKKSKVKNIIVWQILLLTVFVVLWTIVLLQIMDIDKTVIAKRNLVLPSLIIIVMSGATLSTLLFRKKGLLALLGLIFIFLVSFDMLRFSKKWQPFDPKENVFKEIETTEYYSKEFGEDRFIGDFTAENSVFYQLPTLGGYDPLYPRRYGEFVSYVNNGSLSQGERSVVNFPKGGEYSDKAIDFLGTKYIAHRISDTNMPWAFPFSNYPIDQFTKLYDDGRYQVFQNNKSFPRAFIVNDFELQTEKKKILNTMFDESFDLRTQVVIEENVSIDIVSNLESSAKITEYNSNQIKIEASSSADGILVLTDNYYPGWTVLINGRKEKVLRVNYTFRGVVIPEGKSTVEFIYKPKSFTNGVALAVIALFGIVISLITFKKTRFFKHEK